MLHAPRPLCYLDSARFPHTVRFLQNARYRFTSLLSLLLHFLFSVILTLYALYSFESIIILFGHRCFLVHRLKRPANRFGRKKTAPAKAVFFRLQVDERPE